ncbi:MAG: acetyl-CoA decarbonylase/synthase complex subunit gamma [Chloroflexota bacterium]|nr:acetyl-CoA decarbonylase/synthase complex subunit gamma [Chloroflexota bacterium]
MPLSGLEIYKFLPKSNCKKCGFPTCLAFAMKLALKQAELAKCPDISDEAQQALAAAARPPIRLVSIGSGDRKVEVGNEVVLFRHEKTFFHAPGFMVRLKDTTPAQELSQRVGEVKEYAVERVGRKLVLDGFAVENASGSAPTFAQCAATVAQAGLPLVLMARDPKAMEAALAQVGAQKPLIYAATKDNAADMAALAKKYQCPLAVYEPQSLEALAGVVDQVTKAGVEDVVLDPGARDFASSLSALTQIRRLALKKSFRPLGYPVIVFPGEAAASPEEEAMLAGQQVAKYAGVVVLDRFSPAMVYPLITLRMNIYTDPQKPIQVSPGIYPIGSPKASAPLLITTNFSLTYFSVAGEVEASRFPSWLLVVDSEGLSVLTAWAAGKFDAARIAKAVKGGEVAKSVGHKSLVIPGHVAVLMGELEEELPGWKIMVGPREAIDIGGFLKRNWAA